MENEKSFLETWKEVIKQLKEDGLVSQEEYNKGVQVPIEWLCSTGIDRDSVITAIRDLHQKQHPQSDFKLTRFKKYANLFYCEKEGKPSIEIYIDGKNSIFITDEKMPSQGWNKNVTSNELVLRMAQVKKQRKLYQLMNECKMSREEATTVVNLIFDSNQMQCDLYAMPQFLSEMAINFGTYYRYMEECRIDDQKKAEEEQQKRKTAEEEKIKEEENKEPIVIKGGLIDPAVDSNATGTRGPIIGPKIPRKSEIYDFQQRNEIFQNLGPELIVKFDGIDKRTREIIIDAHNCYVFKKPQQNNGYLVISEPFQGDKEAQAFYLEEDFIKDLQKGHEDLEKFWKELTRTYIEEMTRSEFAKEGKTYTFRHTGDIEEYRQKIEGVVNGLENNSQKATVQRASLKLFSKYEYKDVLNGVTRSRYNNAKRAILGERENTQTNENEGETIDE